MQILNNRWKPREIDLLAAAALVGIVLLGLAVRRTLSPDGVSYLDLADALRRGDWRHFVQGYWSPLYPALLASAAALTGASTKELVASAHMVNVLAVGATILVIWRWSRAMASPWFGRAAIAALIVCSAEPPRVEALTPDLILLWIVTCIGYELLVHRGRRWAWLGILFGLAYLDSTGTWPWIIIAMIARVAVAPDRAARRLAIRSDVVTTVIALLWILPMSAAINWVTIGSARRLERHWYLESSDARTPDTHRGEHEQYQQVPITDSVTVRVASFDTTARWTYQPWSDPDGWSNGIRTHQAAKRNFGGLLSYWLDGIWLAISTWLRLLFLAVLLPAAWIGRRRGGWRELLVRPWTGLLVAGLGIAGILQCIAVRAEPRLVAPFALLFALTSLVWLLGDRDDGVAVPSTPDRLGLALMGLVIAGYLTARRIDRARTDDLRIAAGLERLTTTNDAAFSAPGMTTTGLAGALTSSAPAHPRVAVIGPVLPVLANIYWIGGRVTAQVPPMSVTTLRNLPTEQRSTMLHDLFHDRADVLWITASDGSYNIVRVP